MKSAQSSRIQQLDLILREEGVRASLIYLNSLTSYRFTALFMFSGNIINVKSMYDYQNPDIDSLPWDREKGAYCEFVRDSNERFILMDSLTDDRVKVHPLRPLVRSYHGLPVRDAKDKLLGALCHFDPAPVAMTKDNIAVMEQAAKLVAKRIKL